jgi:hypothetical protein
MTKGKDWPVDEGEDKLALKIIAEAMLATVKKIMGTAWYETYRNPELLPIEPEPISLLISSIGGNQRAGSKEQDKEQRKE